MKHGRLFALIATVLFTFDTSLVLATGGDLTVRLLPVEEEALSGPSNIRLFIESEGIEEIDLETTLITDGQNNKKETVGVTLVGPEKAPARLAPGFGAASRRTPPPGTVTASSTGTRPSQTW